MIVCLINVTGYEALVLEVRTASRSCRHLHIHRYDTGFSVSVLTESDCYTFI